MAGGDPEPKPAHSQAEASSRDSQQQHSPNEKTTEGQGQDKVIGHVQLLIRNPNKLGDLNLKADLSWTVAQLKEIIRQKYDGHPPAQEQVLIHAGKVLKEPRASLREVLRKVDCPGPYSMHLVIQSEGLAQPQSGRSSTGMRMQGDRSGGSGTGGLTRRGSAARAMRGGDGAAGQSSQPPPPPGAGGVGVEAAGPMGRGQIAMVPSGAVALPCMMMSPVVTAAYNAAMAAMSNSAMEGGSGAQQGGGSSGQGDGASASGTSEQQGQAANRFLFVQNPLMPAFMPGFPGQTQTPQAPQLNVDGQGQTPQGDGNNVQAHQHQNAAPHGLPNAAPLIPAIAFFPLGMPVMVPASNPPQGFHPQMYQPPTATRYVQLQGNRAIAINPGQQPMQVVAQQQQQPQNQNRGGRRRRVVMFRISIRGLLQLIFVLTILYNYCTKERFFLLVGIFVLLYMSVTPLRWLLNQVSGTVNQPANRVDPNQNQNRARGFVRELLTLIVGFITSVLPSWNINAQDDAAFAAAQEMIMREGEGERDPNANANGNANANANPNGNNNPDGNGNVQPQPQQWNQQQNQDPGHQHQD